MSQINEKNMNDIIDETESRAILISLITPDNPESECHRSLDELERLADTAGIVSCARLTQSRSSPDTATYIGKGKIEEAKSVISANDINIAIIDDELSPSQIRNIEESFGELNIEVIDRTMLILEIFSRRAHSSEGKLQIEIALLRYTLPRLTGKGKDMSRLGGGMGGGVGARRGAGETKLEIERRNLKSRISAGESELKHLELSREIMRKRRKKSAIPNIAIAGYTNSGKSTLLNYLTDAGILAEDKLFATLDPTTRNLKMPSGAEILLTDTVGFINKLPHHLIKAFKSTLNEINYSDVILIVADISDSEHEEQLEVAKSLISEMGATDKPIIIAYNKIDKIDEVLVDAAVKSNENENVVYISAVTGEGIDRLLNKIEEVLSKQKSSVSFLFPLSDQSSINNLYKNSKVLDIEYRDDSIAVKAVVDNKTKGMYKKYLIGV